MESSTGNQQDQSCDLRDWRVGVISTDYDLKASRKALINELGNIGFSPIAFEQSDFPVQPGMHSHEACVNAVRTMDIVVLVLNRRYGGLYLGVEDVSVTEREFWTAYKWKTILIPCVAKKLYGDRHRCKKKVHDLRTQQGLSEDQAKNQVIPEYADGWELLDFLERIQHADRDQFMIFYENTDELLEKVVARLAAITPHLCRYLLYQQLVWVNSQRSTSGLFESLGHVATSTLYVSPPARIISGETKKKKPSSVIAEMIHSAGSVLLTGAPGSGKTVELVRAFKRHAKKALNAKEFHLPFYVPLKGRGLWYHFDFTQYINEAFAEFLGRRPYPCFDPTHLDPVFFLDGLDEGPVTPTIDQVESVAGSQMLRSTCVMTARTSLARNIIDRCTQFASKISARAELLSWTRGHASVFVSRYLKAQDRDQEINAVQEYILNLSETHPVIKSPLILSLFLWLVVSEGATNVCTPEMGLSMVFELFLQTWASRELTRCGHRVDRSLEEDSKMLLDLWETAAWRIFQAREESVNLTTSDLKEQIKAVSAYNIEDVTHLLSSPAFSGIIRLSHRGKIVTGMVHDQFTEYLLARWFVAKCRSNQQDLRNYLCTQTNVDVNRFIKAIWSVTAEVDLKATLKTLDDIASDSNDNESKDALMINANCVYYISRIPLADIAKVTLRNLFKEEKRLYCRNGILFALLRLGDMDAEQQLYNSLSSNIEADELNRGLHLEYFKDALPGDLGTPPKDNSMFDWEQCLIGLIGHLEDDDERFILSRRIDLFTIRSFICCRRELGPLTQERLNRIYAALDGYKIETIPKDFRANIETELNNLLKIVRLIELRL